MIELIWKDAFCYPTVFCDSCGKKISDAKLGAVVFRNFGDNGQRSPPRYVHKSSVKDGCMDKAEEAIRSNGGQSGWRPLTEHLAYLVDSVGMTPNDMKKILS